MASKGSLHVSTWMPALLSSRARARNTASSSSRRTLPPRVPPACGARGGWRSSPADPPGSPALFGIEDVVALVVLQRLEDGIDQVALPHGPRQERRDARLVDALEFLRHGRDAGHHHRRRQVLPAGLPELGAQPRPL